MIKLGIIGTGMIVHHFLPVITAQSGYEVRCILSTKRSLDKAKELCDLYAVPTATDDFEVLCGSGVDTVYVAVPNLLHFDYCRRALERGLHVIVEKPLACTDGEVRKLMVLAQEKKRFLFEAITTRYLESYRTIDRLLPRIGEVKLVQSQFCQFSSRYEAFQRGEIAPVFDLSKAGGAMMDLNLYNLHFVLGLFGAPKKVAYTPVLERGVDTGGVTVLEYPGFLAVCTAAKSCGGAGWGLIQGTKGCIRTTGTANWVGDVVLELRDGTREVYPGAEAELRAVAELQEFERAIREEDWALCREAMEQSLAVSELMTRLRHSVGLRFPGEE